MDELDLIREFRAQDATPNPNARSAARERLQAHLAASPPPARRRQRLHWPTLGLVTAAVAAVALVVVVGQHPGSSSFQASAPERPGAAALSLEHAARAAEADTAPGAGQPFHAATLEERQHQGRGFNFVVVSSRDVWRDADGGGRVLTRPLRVRFPSSADRRRWRAAGAPHLLPARSEQRLAPGTQRKPADIAALPSDPAALAARVGSGHDREVMATIAELLGEAPAPAPVRAGLYRLIERLPGVRLLGPARDGAGRRGVTISAATQTLTFDPATGRLLARRDGENVTTYLGVTRVR